MSHANQLKRGGHTLHVKNRAVWEWQRGKHERRSEVIVQWSRFISFSTGTPETLITWTPPTNLEHTLVPTVTCLMPYNITTCLLYGHKRTQKVPDTGQSRHQQRRWEGIRGGSTHIQRVLVDDDEGHAMCHQTTWVTWEAETLDGSEWGMGGGLDLFKPKTQVKKLVSCRNRICKIPLRSHTDIWLLSAPSASSRRHILLWSLLHSSSAKTHQTLLPSYHYEYKSHKAAWEGADDVPLQWRLRSIDLCCLRTSGTTFIHNCKTH